MNNIRILTDAGPILAGGVVHEREVKDDSKEKKKKKRIFSATSNERPRIILLFLRVFMDCLMAMISGVR